MIFMLRTRNSPKNNAHAGAVLIISNLIFIFFKYNASSMIVMNSAFLMDRRPPNQCPESAVQVNTQHHNPVS